MPNWSVLYCRSVLGCTGVPEGAQVTAL